jgi:hypothetical protein
MELFEAIGRVADRATAANDGRIGLHMDQINRRGKDKQARRKSFSLATAAGRFSSGLGARELCADNWQRIWELKDLTVQLEAVVSDES